ncbi:ARF guanine-nucleotide exchange factor GNOM [Aegilops tauschii subsp. strangulata]|uniref:ARF guanine-nucleotide exchange factor GNOM n=1 Tax=Aegilops tauschii subsp. strangulata TaxID=200361 RepID=UPI00098A7563|nr:LOW QUALITY PROTEIN: ARF guanine-nucleotide exchange factor GNOM [Aegilops tauschii subsp. strangulata]
MREPPPPSPSPSASRAAMACVVTSEVATVLAIMRRNVRWAAGGDDDPLDHPLIAGLKSLRRAAATWSPRRWRDVEPLLYLGPFLDVVRSDEAGAPATGAALSSLHKVLSLDLVGPDAPGADRAMAAVVEAVAGCRFEVTDAASEEAVLARALQVLLACVRGRAAPALSNRHVCDIVNTCFRVVQQAGAKGELLQRVSRQTMQEVVRCVFARLPDIDATTVADHKIASKNEVSSAGEMENGSDSVCLSSSQDKVGGEFGVVQDKAMMELFGVPCMVEILQFLCSLLNIAEDSQVDPNMNPIDFDEDMPLFALGLINSAIELSTSSIQRHPKLLAFVQDELFRNLMQFGLSDSPLILSTICSVIFTLFYHLRRALKLQIEAFFACVILRLTQSRYGASYQQQEVALETLVDFCQQKDFMVEMYTNMDCDLQCSNVFEDLVNVLSKSAFPEESTLSTLNVLALDGLVAVIQAIAERIGNSPQHCQQPVQELSEYFSFWQLKCENINDPDQWVRFVNQQKSIKRKLMVGVEHFNRDRRKGFEYLQAAHLLPEKLDPRSVALFFRYSPGLDKNLLGDYLGNHDEFSIQVLHEFSGTFDFEKLNLDAALRLFLETFRLPGESQKIQRILEAFSDRYYEESPELFVNRDAALVLSYSVILLNTDQHNVRVKNKMSEEDFIRNNRRINGGNDLPREFLSELYYSICRNEIKTIPEQGVGCSEMSFSRWADLMFKSKRASAYIACHSYPFLDHDMFLIMARPTVAAISVIFDNVEQEEILTRCIDGFLSVAKLAAFYHLNDVLNDLVVALGKFTILSIASCDDPATAFGEDTKARMATEALFTIAATHGDHINRGWRTIVDCILRFHEIGLLPACLTNDTADDEESFSASLPTKVSQVEPKKTYGLMGRFTQLLYLDAEEPRFQPTEEQLAAQRNASETIKKCQIGTIFTESKFLQADSLLNLARALIQAAGQPPKITSSIDGESNAVICLELIIAVTLNNRDRIVVLWHDVFELITHIVQSTVMPCNLVEKAVFGLLDICQRLLPYKENLVDDLLRSLQLILKLDARVADAYCESITQKVACLVKDNATHIKSQMGWQTIISLLCVTAHHPDASDAGFEALIYIMFEGAHLSPANFVLSVEAARQFAQSRLGSAERSIHSLNLMAESVNCLARWSHEVKEAGGEAERMLEGIAEMWLRLVQALRKVCTDQREQVRDHALVLLHRCLVVDGISVPSSVWLMSFDIVFHLLDELLEIAQNFSPKDFRNMESSLLHAVKLLSKLSMQSLNDLSAHIGFSKLWLEVLDMIEKLMKAKVRGSSRTERLQEAATELLKNILLAMKASGILSSTSAGGENSLWEATWLRVNKIAPSLQPVVFPDYDDAVQGSQSKLDIPAVSEGRLVPV